jgi:hypothetical protein
MTTCTVAFPGVSRLTRGVRIVQPLSLQDCSIPGSYKEKREDMPFGALYKIEYGTWELGQENAILPNASALSMGPATCANSRRAWRNNQ